MAGDLLFGRICKLTINIPVASTTDFSDVTPNQIEINSESTPEAQGLRVQFKINKSTQKEPNNSEITVTNLSPTNRGKLQVKGVKVILEAGYIDTGLTRLFYGDARTIDHLRDGADWKTVFKLGDGERAYRNARISQSFSGGAGASDVLNYLGAQSGLAIGNVSEAAAGLSTTFDQGYVLHGKWSDEMQKLANAVGFTWSIQNGALQVLAPGESIPGVVPEISPESGLIGSPEMGTPEKKGKPGLLEFKCLLQPMVPGGRIKIVSKRYNGFITIKKLEFEGDTESGPWYSSGKGVLNG